MPIDLQLNSATVTEVEARRAANRYLTLEVGIAFSATDPVFIALEQPLWQFSIRFRLPHRGTLAMMGTIDVDAQARQVRRLSNLKIREIQKRANAIVEFAPSAAAA